MERRDYFHGNNYCRVERRDYLHGSNHRRVGKLISHRNYTAHLLAHVCVCVCVHFVWGQNCIGCFSKAIGNGQQSNSVQFKKTNGNYVEL